MLRRTDGFGFLGIVMLVAGITLYFTGSFHRISLLYWLGGPILWFAGFALVVGSTAARLLPDLKNTRSSSNNTSNVSATAAGHIQKGDHSL